MSAARNRPQTSPASELFPLASGEQTLLPASFPGIDELIESCWATVAKLISRHGYGNLKTKIHLALHEALVNAWQHGNDKRPDLPLVFRWRFAEDFSFEVRDSGPGFSREALPDHRSPERLSAENGRGLAIIRFCADRLRWEENGALVIVSFAKPPAGNPA